MHSCRGLRSGESAAKLAPSPGLLNIYMAHLVGLAISLCLTWLLLSGHYTPLLLGLGTLSITSVMWIAHRMDGVDHVGQRMPLTLRVSLYWLWLLGQIFLSSIDVARRILNPRLPISPCVIKVKAHQQSDLGQVIYANSITLTPGTVSMRVADGEITVHALTAQGAQDLASGEMDQRVQALEQHQ